jgi:putative ABC transport system permease protein
VMISLDWLNNWGRDLKYALRLYRRRPVMAASALVTLTVGIGLNAAVLTVAHAVLWRELSLPEGNRLVYLSEVGPPPARQLTRVSPANALDWETTARTLDGLATLTPLGATLLDGTEAEEVPCVGVSRAFFRILPIPVVRGRLLSSNNYAGSAVRPERSEASLRLLRPEATVISHALWRRQFGARDDIIGQRVRFRHYGTAEIVGVLDDAFHFPMFGGVDCWFPDDRVVDQRATRYLMVIGRLAATATVHEAQAEFDVIGARLATQYPEANRGRGVAVTPLRMKVTAEVQSQLWFLTGAALCVLLIVCANVSNLLVAHATSSRREFATRRALGATQAQMIRQVMTESLVLAVAGGITGFVLATWSVPWLIAQAPERLPRLNEVAIGLSTLLFSVGVALAVGLISGLGAVLASGMSRLDEHMLGRRLRESRHSYRHVLVIGEVALALLLAVMAGLLVQTMRAVSALPLGFEKSHAYSIGFSPDMATMRARGGKARFDAALVDTVRAVPGVVSVGIGPRPLGAGPADSAIAFPAAPSEFVQIEVSPVGPGYFEALGTTLLDGRFLDERDGPNAPLVAILNERAGRSYFPNGAVGEIVLHRGNAVEIVGVVANVRISRIEREPAPMLFLASAQPSSFQANNLIVRTASDTGEVVPAIRTVVRRFDPELPLTEIEALDDLVAAATASRRFTLTLVLLFSVTALGLAVVGIYGVIADWSTRRTPEIGIRMALGATRGAVLRMVVLHGGAILAIGVTIGTVAALILNRFMEALVFGVPTTDAASYTLSAIAVTLAGLAACVVPAQRAAHIDPATVLRDE